VLYYALCFLDESFPISLRLSVRDAILEAESAHVLRYAATIRTLRSRHSRLRFEFNTKTVSRIARGLVLQFDDSSLVFDVS
jgi:hypothetical protein